MHYKVLVVGPKPDEEIRKLCDYDEEAQPIGRFDYFSLGGRFNGLPIRKYTNEKLYSVRALRDDINFEEYIMPDCVLIFDDYFENVNDIDSKTWKKQMLDKIFSIKENVLISSYDAHS